MPRRVGIQQRLLSGIFALLFCLFAAGSAWADVSINAASYILIEGSTGKLLLGENVHTKLPMASTTKIMTALVALENASLSDMVTVPQEAYGTEGSSIYLKLGEKLSLKDLLFGLMLSSGNDAAVAIAIHVGGSTENFALMMNEKAAALGLSNTNFVTPNGLHDDEHYTTAYDLAHIAAAAMANPVFCEIVSTPYYRTETGDTVRTFRNKNKILSEYEGGCGVKTGYTSKAGRCLVFAAKRDGMLLIGVVLRAPDMFNDAEKILDFGFSNYEMRRIVESFAVIAHIPIEKCKNKNLDLLAKEDIMIPIGIGGEAQFRTQVEIWEGLYAPIKAGDVCGRLTVLEDGHILAAVDLIAAQDAEALDFAFYLRMLYSRWIC